MNKKGFTLIELLVVIGILGILMGVVVVAVNPARQFAQARNAQRWSNVNTLLNAVGQSYVDTGSLPSGITTTVTEVCIKITGGSEVCTGLVDLSALTPDFIVNIPADPTGASGEGAGYTIVRNAALRVTVAAPDAELSVPGGITVTR